MRYQLLKLTKRKSTKAERIFSEILKRNKIAFRTKIRIKGREIDFLIEEYAIEIDGHDQLSSKNHLLIDLGYTPLHYSNQEIYANPLEVEKSIIRKIS